jgi:hypothetical protein
LISCVAIVAVSGPSIRADVPPNPGVKSVPVETVIEVNDPFPDYVFFESHIEIDPALFGRRTTGPPPIDPRRPKPKFTAPVEIELSPEQPIRFAARLDIQQQYYAIPRAALDQFPDREQLIAAVHQGSVAAAAWSICQRTAEIPVQDPHTFVVERYRLERTANGVAFTPLKPSWFDRHSNSGRYLWIFAGVLAAAGVVGIGFWWVRCFRRKRSGSNESPADQL